MKNKTPKKTGQAASKKTTASKSKPSAKKTSRTKGEFCVHGQVHLFDGRALADVLVRAVDKDMYGKENLLGEVRSDKKGYFSIDYTEEQFRRTDKEKGGADLIVRIVDAQGTIIASSRKINSAKSDETVNVMVGAMQAPTPEHFIVHGIVTQDGKPLVGVVVKAYDKDVRREEWLGEATTDETGNYEISYDYDLFGHAEQNNADVFIRVFDKDAKLLGTSRIMFNASLLEEINYDVGDKKSKWEELNAVLIPLLKEQKLSDYKPAVIYRDLLPAELESTDIQFLSHDAGIDDETIRKWAHAYVVAADPMDIPAEVFYGWFSRGLPEQLPDLWTISVENLMDELKQAIVEEIVPASLEASLEKIRAKIQRVQNEVERAPLLKKIEILSADFKGNQDLVNTFTKLYLDNQGDWSVIKPLLKADTSFPSETLNNVFFTHGLMTWSNSNTDLINTFQQDTTTHSLRDIAINFDKQTLAGKIPDSAIPSSETKENFTTDLYNALYAMEPTGVVVNMINNPKIPLWNNETGNMVSGVLSKVPEFNIKTTSVHNVINNKDAFGQIPQEKIAEVVNHLKILQRVTLVSPVPEAIPVLINNNFLSTYTITVLPQAQFMETMQSSELPYETLQYIYEEAGKKNALYERILMTVKEAGVQTGIAMIDGYNSVTIGDTPTINYKVEEVLVRNNLSWDLLFGDADFCECGECTSVYSAAAYYVDLLQYLRNNNLTVGTVKTDSISNTPLEKLFARRPDLGHLELTCKNTNTILPYVDLVNEVMEQYIAFKLKAENFGDYEGFNVVDETSGELLSAPQHTEQEEAYQALQTTFFPFNLPYHQPIDTARLFLNNLNTSRYELIDTFRSNNSNINFGVAADAESLGLTEEEYSIITRESFTGVVNTNTTDVYYGLGNTANWLDTLSQIKDEFLPRTGLLYTELIELLKTEYINPGFAKSEYTAMLNSLSLSFSEALDLYEDDMGGDLAGLFSSNPDLEILLNAYTEDVRLQKLSGFFTTVANCIVLNSPHNQCTLDGVILLHCNNTALTGNDYDKIQRFIRLWRKLGFTIDETDQVIMTLGSGAITPELIHQLVALKKIMTYTGLEVTKLLCWWGNIGTAGENSLYKRLFLSHNLTAMDNVFEADLTGSELLSDHLPVVMAALNLSDDDISLIRIYKSLPESLALTLENLSLLYRYRILSKMLGLRIPAFIKLAEVVGNVFEDPDTTLRFLKNVTKVEEAGFSIDQLGYVTNGTAGINTAFSPTKKDVIILAKKIYDGLPPIEIVTALSEQTGLDKTVVQSLIVNILEIDGFSVYDQLTSPTPLPAPTSTDLSWYGKLIPVSDDDYTFVARSTTNAPFRVTLDNLVVLEHPSTLTPGTVEWQSAELKLVAGKVYQLSLEGILLENLYWKTSGSTVEPIPTKALLPDFKKKATRAALEKLTKMAILVKGLSLSADELTYMHTNRADFNSLDFNDLSFYHLVRIIDYCNLRNSLPTGTINILQFWEHLDDTETQLSEHISHLTKWKKENIDKFISQSHFNLTKDDFKNEKNLLKLQQASAVASTIGMDVDTLFEWAVPTSDFEVCKSIADNIQKMVRSQYNQTDWEQVVKPMNDVLRSNQKNALIAYLLQQPELKAAGVIDADGLFEYFLIDVQMDTCMETSRIKQAISSAQLFIQRCFLGLEEPGIAPTVLSRDRWDWMQRYRVWEANRKIFLYPENWIESNLRDDKSPFFKELESELLQKDINKQNVTDALKAYLYKVDEVANMEVVGLYIEGERNDAPEWNKGSKLHVFSRTRNAPYFFYYRYLALDEMNWYPWEKVQVDIPSYDVEEPNGKIGNGCYLTPVVWNGRLLIFFPQFVKKSKPLDAPQNADIAFLADLPTKAQKSTEYWEIKLAFSEYKNNKWQPKQVGSPVLLDAPNETYFSLQVTQMLTLKRKLIALRSDIEKVEKEIASLETSLKNTSDIPVIMNILGQIITKLGSKTLLLSQLNSTNASYVNQRNAVETSQRNSVSRISQFIIFSVIYNNGASLAIKVFRDQTRVGAFEFDGNAIGLNVNSPINVNGYLSTYFQYSNASFLSIQVPANHSSDFLFTTPPVKINNQKPFHFLTASQLMDKSSGELDNNFFGYNLQIQDKENGFGLLSGAASDVYHELKRPYSLYNWELFFHTPIMIANTLSKAQQFEESMKWFHYVFNPIADGPDDNRFWNFRPFKEIDGRNIVEQIFSGLTANEPDPGINEWRNNPFKPHVVARSRPVAYMKWVVMKYIDNILDWGDYLFRQDTLESINQATQLYVLAGHILGRKPMMIPKRGETKTQSYLSLLNKWDAFSNAISELEISAIYTIQPTQYSALNTGTAATVDFFSSPSALYFCIPNNPKLMAYWDTVADRLFKIRHCQNIEGVFRKLPLFESPIDPALLVKAAAQGLSISSVLNDLNTPMPNYRFYYLLQKALELCNELKSLGGAMLSAIEKKDNETISLIRARHEGSMNNLMMEVKKLQLEEAQKSLESLQLNRKAPEARMKYYLQLTGEDVNKVPTSDGEFTELANSIETPVNESGLRLSKYEKEDVDKASEAQDWQRGIGVMETMASIMHLIPDLFADVKPFGIGAGGKWGGLNLGNAVQAVARGLQVHASDLSFASSNAAKKGGFQRAMQDRIFQANAAGYELKQIDKQITTQQIRINIANQEIRNQQKQIENVSEVEEFLKNKYTNEELYTWMRGSLKTLYHQVYTSAYDLAKKAERTYCFERGISQANFIQSGYFDAGREGLLAGEQLYVGLKQLEAAYQENRGYDFEITKHVSLRQLDPLALLRLKTRSSCEFTLPEVLFDMDYPGHFKRRIKSVSVSIPCIAGPYTGVNATLRLLSNKFRNSSMASNAGSYPEKTNEQDERFVTYNIPITAIATSSGQNDAGMFELSFKDERYLPFEGAGVISGWRLELPTVKQFDYTTISDVVLHIKYMASEGGDQLKNAAGASVISQLNSIRQQLTETGLHIPVSLKHDMPNEWNALKQNGTTEIKIDKSRLPYFAQVATPGITAMLISKSSVTIKVKRTTDPQAIALSFSPLGDSGLQKAEINNITLGNAFVLSGDQTALGALDELILLVKFTI